MNDNPAVSKRPDPEEESRGVRATARSVQAMDAAVSPHSPAIPMVADSRTQAVLGVPSSAWAAAVFP